MSDRGDRYAKKEPLKISKSSFNFQELELLERLADLEHRQWSHIINYLLSENMLQLGKMKTFEYRQLAKIPYSKLSESQKDSDREWARKVLKIIKNEWARG